MGKNTMYADVIIAKRSFLLTPPSRSISERSFSSFSLSGFVIIFLNLKRGIYMDRCEKAVDFHKKGCNCAQAVACAFSEKLGGCN